MARHRRAQRPSRAGLVTMTVVVIAAGAVVSRADTWWPEAGPFVTEAEVGEPVHVEPVRVTVHGARAATVLADGLNDLDSEGVWIAVDVTAAALDQPAGISGMMLRDRRGREYASSNRVTNPMIGSTFDPRVPERGEVVFEVPSDALGRFTLVVSPDAPGRTVPRAEAEMPLRVDEAADEPLTPRSRDLAEGQADTGARPEADGPREPSVHAACPPTRNDTVCLHRRSDAMAAAG
ncbi:hypothetical protein E1262_26505 [Jiangella aurantiaca]|uniref:DUF4352 domain-containing protein n=1 Tax=Jiangella aurantiaca TaxID=2530373 RepID=A0A4R4ZZY5_9ACTN|nr:hypothetical protein [Jiangella aurantiaca]TDD65003.1 hypothetical protein E1262_26505 [Jiangella aurantiaca]